MTGDHRWSPRRAAPIALLVIAFATAACGASAAATSGPTLRLESEPALAGDSGAPQGSSPPSSAALSGQVGSAAPSEALASHVADGSNGPTSSSEPGSSDVPFPNPNEATLLAHVVAAVRPTCDRADQFYADELDSISCGGDPDPFVDYTLFGSVDDLNAAFDGDEAQSESPPQPGGSCAKADYQSTYQLSGAIAGRIQCTTRTANGQTYRVIEWTRDGVRILGYLSSATISWTDMIAFWKSKAGPTG